MPVDPDPVRRRRSSAEVRRLLIEGAQGAVTAGASDPTVEDIAARAGVARTALFRHFGTKAALIAVARGGAEPPSAPDPDRARLSILDAARELFSARGFSHTSTREIAERAGVAEVVVFRTFGTKAALFRESVFEPFGGFISDYAARWSANTEPHSAEAVSRGYLEGLYRLLREHSSTAMALFAARAHEPPGVADSEGQQAALREVVHALEKLCAAEADYFGYDELNVPYATRISIAMVLATALFKDWLFDDSSPAGDDDVVAELTAMLLHGISRSSEPAEDGLRRQLAAAHQRIAELEAITGAARRTTPQTAIDTV